MEETINEMLDSASSALSLSSKYHLESEVIVWALLAMKKNPELSVSDALDEGLNEWIK